MGFLRTLFWIAVTVAVVIFSVHNWTSVTLDLFGGLQADVKLPMLLLAAFLLGFLPLYVFHRIHRWRYRRQMTDLNRPTGLEPATASVSMADGAVASTPFPAPSEVR